MKDGEFKGGSILIRTGRKWRFGTCLLGIACLLMAGIVNAPDCMAKVKWYSDLQSGLAQAKATKKWVFVDIGADW